MTSTRTAMPTTAVITRVFIVSPCTWQNSNAAEPAGPPVVLLDGGVQVGRGKIGPEDVHLHQLGVGRLPEHEVGQPLFPAGAQDQVRVLLAGGPDPAP